MTSWSRIRDVCRTTRDKKKREQQVVDWRAGVGVVDRLCVQLKEDVSPALKAVDRQNSGWIS